MKQIIEIINKELGLSIDENEIKTAKDLYYYCKNNDIDTNIIAVLYETGNIYFKIAEIYATDKTLKNMKEAINNYLKAAEYENLPSLAMLTKIYYFGEDVEKDYNKALYFGNRILDNIDKMKSENIIFNEEVQEDVLDDIKFAKTMASDILFNMYYFGEGTKKDTEKAFIMAKNSAELGVEKAQYNLAQMYEKGIGTYKDYERAVFWYKKAIDNNYVEGELYYRLGNLYDKGLGVKENKSKGKRLMRKALDLGYAPIN